MERVCACALFELIGCVVFNPVGLVYYLDFAIERGGKSPDPTGISTTSAPVTGKYFSVLALTQNMSKEIDS